MTSGSILHLHHHYLCFFPSPLPTNCRPFRSLSNHHFGAGINLHPRPRCRTRPERTAGFLCRTASLTGSGPEEYDELLLGNERDEMKGRKVAGVDQEQLLDPEMLADPDSLFYSFNGVKLHHKIYQDEGLVHKSSTSIILPISSSGTEKIGFPMILLHGFGASLFSWSQVMKQLARLTESKVIAFDRPAFGLTSRVKLPATFSSNKNDTTPLNPYSMAFAVLATFSFFDMLNADKVILMGHSAGCLVAVNTYFQSPERVAALILVAPAIIAPFIQPNNSKLKNSESVDNSDYQEDPTFRIWKKLYRLYISISWMAIHIMKVMKDMVYSIYKKALSAIFRSTVAMVMIRIVMDKFGILGVRNAWYDASQVTDYVIQGYTKPLRVKGWEMALLEYTLSMLTDSSSESKNSLAKGLSEISCPVLIVSGDTDRLIPSWNAVRLSSVIPGSTLEVIKKCGHIPHEEKPEEFLAVVEKFLQTVRISSQTVMKLV